jgi:predicted TIM-barrel enzyme
VDLMTEQPELQVFGSIAFKYQPLEADPPLAASNAAGVGMIPTTSGAATGRPPTLEKIVSMSEATGGRLAVASGMSCENITAFSPHLSHALVSTGVSLDDYHFDVKVLTEFVRLAHKQTAADKTR